MMILYVSTNEEIHTNIQACAKNERVREERQRRMDYCDVHPDMIVNFYCDDCRCPVCGECALLGDVVTTPTKFY